MSKEVEPNKETTKLPKELVEQVEQLKRGEPDRPKLSPREFIQRRMTELDGSEKKRKQGE